MKTCVFCSQEFSHTHANQRYCSDTCRYRRQWRDRSKGVCARCGATVGYSANVKGEGEHLCKGCKGSAPAGTPERRAKDAARARAYRQRRRAEGRALPGGSWISRRRRRAIYERDAWTCWLCESAVNPDLIGTRDPLRPSLDHVQTRVSGGDDSDENLRLAHWLCNAQRSDGPAPERLSGVAS